MLMQRWREMLLLLVCVLLLHHAAPHIFAQSGSPNRFHIVQMLQNETNQSVVAFEVQGSFKENDVVSMYSNDVFIKALAINTPELIGTKKITISNISVDVFQEGDNLIVAKIERDGVELLRTPAFRLTIKSPPSRPTVAVLANQEEGLLAVDVSGVFEEGDVVKVFLNKSEIRSKTLTEEEAQQETVRMEDIPMEALRTGENFFTASITREKYESNQSEKSESITIEETPEEEINETDTQQCINYKVPQKITAPDGKVRDGFGSAITVKDGIIMIGTKSEKVYINTKNKNNTNWSMAPAITDENFKRSGSVEKPIAVYDADTVFIGDPTSPYRKQFGGVMYVYRQRNNVWSRYMTVAPSDLLPYDAFGSHIAAYGGLLAVSTQRSDKSGAVYVYTYTDGIWKAPSRIVPQDTAPNQEFGHSVSIDKNHIAIGAPGDGAKNGAVYVYTQSLSGWYVEKIVQQNKRANTQFGTSVLLHDSMLYVGAMRDDQGTGSHNSGAVYVYARSNNTWQLVQKIVPTDDDTGSEFGFAIARSGNMLAIGAPKSGTKARRGGAVYLYTENKRGSERWALKEIITPEVLKSSDRFGAAVAFEGVNLLIGAYGSDTHTKNTGVIYSYTAEAVICADGEIEEQIVEEEPRTKEELLEKLKKQKQIIDQLLASTTSFADHINERIKNVYNEVTKKQENIVVYDESKVIAQAQRRAAERRGIIAPGLPEEVEVQVVNSLDEVPSPPTEETVRTRDAVVQETESKLGTVIPVANRDLRLGDVHEEVYRLQVFLNENGYLVARQGPGSPGNEVSSFGPATERALRTFQWVNGVPATGVLDKKTRGVILTFVTSF